MLVDFFSFENILFRDFRFSFLWESLFPQQIPGSDQSYGKPGTNVILTILFFIARLGGLWIKLDSQLEWFYYFKVLKKDIDCHEMLKVKFYQIYFSLISFWLCVCPVNLSAIKLLSESQQSKQVTPWFCLRPDKMAGCVTWLNFGSWWSIRPRQQLSNTLISMAELVDLWLRFLLCFEDWFLTRFQYVHIQMLSCFQSCFSLFSSVGFFSILCFLLAYFFMYVPSSETKKMTKKMFGAMKRS